MAPLPGTSTVPYPDTADKGNWEIYKRQGWRAFQTINWAARMIGRPYRWGAGGPNSFDCSGLVYFAAVYGGSVDDENQTDGVARFKKACKHKWTTATIVHMGLSIPKGQEQPGDLIMPTSGHVGICIGRGQMIDAPTAGQNVGIHTYKSVYSIRRIFQPCTQESADNYTAKGTRTQGDPINPDGTTPTDLDEGEATPVGIWQELANTIMEPLTAIAAVFAWLATPHNWMRIGEVLAGMIALLIAARQITRRVR